MEKFDSKTFNPEAFGRYVERVPDLVKTALLESGALVADQDLANMLPAQSGGNYITVPMFGLIDGDAQNYDGETDLQTSGTKTYTQSHIVIGRMKGWEEKQFSKEMTGVDFMDNVAQQVSKYKAKLDQKTLLSILKGVFSMSGTGNEDFVTNHTYDISGEEDGFADATTMNTAIQQATGDNSDVFSFAIMHSKVATNLKNLQVLEYLKYTDANGIQRDLGLATLNGKIVLIDDSMPVEDGDDDSKLYTTYILGKGAIDFEDIGAKVPYEIHRDPKTNGGQDTLYARTRKCFAPFGISYTKKQQASLSPTEDELANGNNWSLVMDTESKVAIEDKAIPIARIISKG